jgi:hypothetical protein
MSRDIIGNLEGAKFVFPVIGSEDALIHGPTPLDG